MIVIQIVSKVMMVILLKVCMVGLIFLVVKIKNFKLLRLKFMELSHEKTIKCMILNIILTYVSF